MADREYRVTLVYPPREELVRVIAGDPRDAVRLARKLVGGDATEVEVGDDCHVVLGICEGCEMGILEGDEGAGSDEDGCWVCSPCAATMAGEAEADHG